MSYQDEMHYDSLGDNSIDLFRSRVDMLKKLMREIAALIDKAGLVNEIEVDVYSGWEDLEFEITFELKGGVVRVSLDDDIDPLLAASQAVAMYRAVNK